ncbi:unnamed protein product, partial [Musa acuminata var. zebrina]
MEPFIAMHYRRRHLRSHQHPLCHDVLLLRSHIRHQLPRQLRFHRHPRIRL